MPHQSFCLYCAQTNITNRHSSGLHPTLRNASAEPWCCVGCLSWLTGLSVRNRSNMKGISYICGVHVLINQRALLSSGAKRSSRVSSSSFPSSPLCKYQTCLRPPVRPWTCLYWNEMFSGALLALSYLHAVQRVCSFPSFLTPSNAWIWQDGWGGHACGGGWFPVTWSGQGNDGHRITLLRLMNSPPPGSHEVDISLSKLCYWLRAQSCAVPTHDCGQPVWH